MNRILLSFPLLASAIPAAASPYSLRMVPAGYTASVIENVTHYQSPQPEVVDIGVGRPVWYGGGRHFSTFPYTSNPVGGQFHITLPAIAIAGFPAVEEAPRAGVACDVDRDGDMDIVRINEWDGWGGRETFQVFLNQGSGNFTVGYRIDIDRNNFHAGLSHFYHVACADFDRDGDPDVAVLMAPEDVNRNTDPWRFEGSLTVRWNNGAGQFATSTVLQSTSYAPLAGMTVADLDHDGDVDILCDDHTTINNDLALAISVRYQNSGTGTFSTFSEGRLRPARLADLNKDGWLDAGYDSRTGLNNGTGSIADITQGSSFSGTGLHNYIYADADADGILDLVTNNGNNLVYQEGDGTGGFNSSPVTLVSLPSRAAAIGAGDSDGDGDTDFFLHLQNGSSAFVENRSLHWKAGADFAPTPGFSLTGVTQIHAADFDLDGWDDLLAVCPSQTRMWIIQGAAYGASSSLTLLKNTSPAVPHSAVVADFDSDGRTDVAYSIPATGEVRMARNTGPLASSWPHSTLASGLAGVSLLTKGDYDTPSGRPDILTCSGTTGALRWLTKSGSSWTAQTVVSSFNPVPNCILAANGSTRPGDEAFALGGTDSTLYLRGYQLNTTWGTLGTNLTAPAPAVPSVMTQLDVTGDGNAEAVFVMGNGNVGYWNFSAAAGGLIGTPGAEVRALTTVDWDRNGRADILCATSTGLCVFLQKSTWVLENLMTSPGGFTAVTVMDVNHDAWMDAAVADSTSGNVSLIYNESVPLALANTSPHRSILSPGKPATRPPSPPPVTDFRPMPPSTPSPT